MHIAFYDGGLAGNQEIRDHIKSHPKGAFARLIGQVRDVRVKNRDYTAETLDRMYGLED